MTNFKSKLTASAISIALLGAAFAPATFAANTIKNNGADSINKIKVTNKKRVKVSQTNQTLVVNGVLVAQDTGGNQANKNTGDGGSVDVTSGDATADVTNKTTTGNNSATVNGCGCPDGNVENTIQGNGSDSYNKITTLNSNKTVVSQSNSTAVINLVGVFQNTGGNQANKNTGDGDVTVDSGDADATVSNTTTTGSNTLTLN